MAKSELTNWAGDSTSSVEVSSNAKGQRSWRVKVYDPDPYAAKEHATEIDEQLACTDWPEPEND